MGARPEHGTLSHLRPDEMLTKHQWMEIEMKVLYLPLIAAVLVSGCGAPFLQMEKVSLLREPSEKKTSVVYYRNSYKYSGDGSLSSTEHLLLQVGQNRRSFPDVLNAFSGDSYKLTDFAARIVNTDGSVQSVHQSDLFSVNLSGEAVTQSEMVALPINGRIQEGDLVEEYMKHHITMPRFGINFSLADVGRGNNIECSVSVPDNLAFKYMVINDTTKPEIVVHKGRRDYVFRWNKYVPSGSRPLFGPLDTAPVMLGYVIPVGDTSANLHPWVGFGDWYLNLIARRIAFDKTTKLLAEKITRGLSSPKAKMDALFNYCQKNIRYEQVYLKNGGYIPNPVPVILKRDYGDCKDYSSALYALAHSIGLKPCLALCYRGRGEAFYPKMPVDQFNHVMVYFRYERKNYWYDGTDTQGIPGLTSDDLINRDALVLQKGGSRIVKIGEYPGDRLSISGTMHASGNGFRGDVTVAFHDQYAVDPLYIQSQVDSGEVADYMARWVNGNLNGSAVVHNSSWQLKPREFILKLDLEIPNCSANVNGSMFTSLKSLFPALFPVQAAPDSSTDIFYFPYYDRVSLDMHLKNEVTGDRDSAVPSAPGYALNYDYRIDPGPLTEAQRPDFLKAFYRIKKSFLKTIIVSKDPK